MIQIKHVKKEFFQGQERTEVLRGVDLTVEEGSDGTEWFWKKYITSAVRRA